MYALIVPALDRTLGGLSNVLSKAEAHCAAKNIKPEALLNYRLFPDMFPFIRQVQLACDFAARGCARLAGADLPSFADTETSFAELQDRIKSARAYIASLPASPGQLRTIAPTLFNVERSASSVQRKDRAKH